MIDGFHLRAVGFLFATGLMFLGCTPLQRFQIPPRPAIEHDSLSRAESVFQGILDEAVNAHKLVGVQLSVGLPDGTIWNGASGTIDLNRRQLMRPSHVVRMGSLTKTYTAVVIFRLIERGLLDLDGTIDRWFPEITPWQSITVRMLLNHSSGIPDLLGMRVMVASALDGSRRWTTDELLEMIADSNPDFEPGTDHRYSNSNYVLLGIIAERTTGKSMGSLYRDEILTPLSLSHTYFLPSDAAPAELVTGYDRSLIPLPGWHSTGPENTAWSSCAYASGGMAATASDILRFFKAIMNREIINEQSFQQMTKFSRARNPKDTYLQDFGSGLFRYGVYTDDAYGHLGLFVGSESVAIFSPEKRFALIVLANVSRIEDSDAIIRKSLDVIGGHNPR